MKRSELSRDSESPGFTLLRFSLKKPDAVIFCLRFISGAMKRMAAWVLFASSIDIASKVIQRKFDSPQIAYLIDLRGNRELPLKNWLTK